MELEDRAPDTEVTKKTDLHVRPDGKTQRYDRQLRLWGNAGQKGLEGASILVVNGTATATQILKNLVLPGIGKFTILDDTITSTADVGNNFFLERTSLGKPRASEVVNLLLELNDGVKGIAITQDSVTFLRNEEALADYTLVITVNCPPIINQAFSEKCWLENLPMINVNASGFLASLRVQFNEMTLIETHPASTIDLRLDLPFPTLYEHAHELDLNELDDHEFAHVPAIVILLKGIEKFKSLHHGTFPSSYKERNELKTLINSMKRKTDAENFEEATSLVVKLAKTTEIPTAIQTLFDDPACTNLTAHSSPFWFFLRAIKEFALKQSPRPVLPLTGSLPDMKATSQGYHTLSSLYRTKAKEDLNDIRTELASILKPFNLTENDISSKGELETFVKHAAYLQVLRGKNLTFDPTPNPKLLKEVDDENSVIPIYVALLASETFFNRHGRWPGSVAKSDDLEEMTDCARECLMLRQASLGNADVPEQLFFALTEVIRAANVDLPQIAALLGGMVAQESIKIITNQYIPLNGTCVYDGIKSRSVVVPP